MFGIILIGKAGSGKDTVAEYLVSRYGFKRYAFADKMKEIGRELFPERFKSGKKPRCLLQDLGTYLRQIDPDVWTNFLFSRIEREKPARAVISDCRYERELARGRASGFVPVFVDCPEEIRQRRLAERDGEPMDREAAGHSSENDVFHPSLLAGVFCVNNGGSLEQLYEQVDKVLEVFGISEAERNEGGAGRPSWAETFMRVAEIVALRSTCLRRKVGAVLVRDNRIIATGYNGAPKGLAHCAEAGCMRQNAPSGRELTSCRAVHAEENCVIQAAVFGVSTVGAELYVTCHPCVHCAKTLVNAGVRAVFCREGYPDPLAEDVLREAGIEVKILR